ncbi:MAG: hypothetical protein A2157_08140 [Deltaproteobacteria bacterium RBG_16_47_11]|nr:MAG: hypothetical protein A2157_08140 [Deltaproteobacteria bacterium RBG_16_47_11]
MISYQMTLRRHLAEYKANRLGVREAGIYRKTGRAYQHLLPSNLRYLNLLESIRAEFREYLHHNPAVRLHADFHHLNSSQALAFNLFYPFLSAGGEIARLIAQALGLVGDIREWHFEYVPDAEEGTNVDVAWQNSDGIWAFCEVKLSESEFGSAKPDQRHEKKFREIYSPRLRGLVDERLLEFHEFCQHYQLLRNISLLATHSGSHVVFLIPEQNNALIPALNAVLDSLVASVRHRVHVAYLEKVLISIKNHGTLNPELKLYAGQLEEKYVVKQGNST